MVVVKELLIFCFLTPQRPLHITPSSCLGDMHSLAWVLTLLCTQKHPEVTCLSLVIIFKLLSLAQVGLLLMGLSRVMLWLLTQELQALVCASISYQPRLKSFGLVVCHLEEALEGTGSA